MLDKIIDWLNGGITFTTSWCPKFLAVDNGVDFILLIGIFCFILVLCFNKKIRQVFCP